MLTHLTISGFAIVDYLNLDFRAGMSVITGETGAGKSIMLDALSLTLGDRAESGQIAAQADKAEITTAFDISDHPDAQVWLREKDLLVDNQCMLRRVLSQDGRSRAYINGSPVTLQDLKSLGDRLVDVHSQHEHQSLLKRDTQRRLLDEFAGLDRDLRSLNQHYDEYRAVQEELGRLLGNNTDQSARLQLLSYQVEELDEAGLSPGEHSQLETEHKRLANAEKSMERARLAIDLLTEGETNGKDLLAQAMQQLDSIEDETLAGVRELLNSSLIQLDEAASDLRHQVDGWDMDPERLVAVERRLGQIYELARKHHVSPDALADLETRLREELVTLNHLDSHIQDLENRLTLIRTAYAQQARDLHEQRRAAASLLEKKVEEQLARLGMKDASFRVEVLPEEDTTPRRNGLDQINWLISTNPGSKMGPLNRIASGGELSRISLAIQVVTAHTSQVPSLIFDEVDQGVGGATAEVVGQLLRQLGEKAQII
ncbi:MAG: DNA repair protein RecN, partial [Gammaproteobacteria bacterium]|nr:DNA repair protein RecN [Gammaproteobacteria bacterium]